MLLSHILSLIGAALTGLQTFLIIYQGNGLCLNKGCEIVDSLTLLPPLYFNIAGLLFFLFVAFGLSQARKGSELWQRFTSLLLLAALAAEAVLVCFQYFITDIFCSYCLIIFSLIVLINLFMGLRQIFRGLIIFSAVAMAFASLDFAVDDQTTFSLEDGTLATFRMQEPEDQLYLFFSSTCPHCETVIEAMKEEIRCDVNFNPVDRVASFTFPNIEISPSFEPRVNVSYLKHLGIREVPAMASITEKRTTVLSGEKAIMDYLRQQCLPGPKDNTSETPDNQSGSYSFPLPETDACTVTEDCQSSTSSYSSPQITPLPTSPEG
ncbi:MAG: hypothetical protein V2I35_01045 [Desulfocapsaceae bacterium]|jgi:hypothetical protein|nr:hypothetical protein [Desulfocapsaceae bacterium]